MTVTIFTYRSHKIITSAFNIGNLNTNLNNFGALGGRGLFCNELRTAFSAIQLLKFSSILISNEKKSVLQTKIGRSDCDLASVLLIDTHDYC